MYVYTFNRLLEDAGMKWNETILIGKNELIKV